MKGPEEDAGLAGKVALISGGGAAGDGIGNGRAAAILLARAGTKVMVADRSLDLAESTAKMIAAEGGTAAADMLLLNAGFEEAGLWNYSPNVNVLHDPADRRGPGGGARKGHHASRSQAGEHHGHP